MGFSLSWVGTRGMTPETVLAELGLRPTGDVEEMPESSFAATSLPSGWYVVVLGRYGHPLAADSMLARLSESAEVIAASLEEHVMCSWATCWRNGHELWRISHDPESGVGVQDLLVSGEPPETFDTIRESAFAEQRNESTDEADAADFVFDVPLDVAESITGYKHDSVEGEFEVLEEDKARPGRRSWWRR
jgi:hypothetical protein